MDPTTAFLLAQSISILTGLITIASMQFKNMTLILLFQVFGNLLASTNYLLLDGGSGAVVSLIGVACTVVMFFYNRKNIKPHLAVALLFMAAFSACSAYNVIVIHDLMELFPAVAACTLVVGLVQTKPFYFRIFGALSPLFWLPYDFYTASYVIFLVHLGILISSVVGMIRLDGVLKKAKNR